VVRAGWENVDSGVSGVSACRRPRWQPHRREDEETTAPEPHSGIEGEGGTDRCRGELTLAELAHQFDVHPNRVTQWKAQLLEGAASVFGSAANSGPAIPAIDLKSLHAKIGELTLENDCLGGALSKAGLLSAKR
jgi:transposase